MGGRVAEGSIDALVTGLERDGWASAKGLLSEALVDGLLKAAITREKAGELVEPGVGRHREATGMRSVQAGWLDGSAEAEREFLVLAETIRAAINRRLFLGLFEFEAQYLSYPSGGFYQRHVDSLQGARNRMVSLVAYLNRGWRVEDGGALVVWQARADGERHFEVLPEAGTVVLMLSEEIPHEAQPTKVPRRAIAGWFRVNASTSGRADPGR